MTQEEGIKRISDVLAKYSEDAQYRLFKDTVDELAKKGIAKGCYQDYGVLCDVLAVLTLCENIIAGTLVSE